MALISVTSAYLAFGEAPLFDHLNLHIEPGERVAIVGRNGTGKSTLLKAINQEIPLDDGRILYQDGLVIARLDQDPAPNGLDTVTDFVTAGLMKQSELLQQYHRLLKTVSVDPTAQHLQQLAIIQSTLDHTGSWQIESRILHLIQQMGLDANAELASLSGGNLRKAAFAKAVVCDPDLLLLDEPTNHLDMDSIDWLESFLHDFKGSVILISHDRHFIQSVATRIVDLDRGQCTSWPGDYARYVSGKEEWLRVEVEKNALFDKKLAQEEVWIRQGIQARRTRNEGRVRALKALRLKQRERRNQLGSVKMQAEQAFDSGKIIFDCAQVNYCQNAKPIITDFSARIMRGDKIALIGPNGCGKTTLLKLLLNQLQPDSGCIQCGTKLEIAYFDQYRATLDLDKSVLDNVAEGKLEVEVNGKRRHILSYLQNFLFAPRRARTPVRALSGGERHRLLLAKLFLKPSNLLILDEPTNDLDMETLELLEELIQDYRGTVLLVSHDRQFVDNCVSQCFIFADSQILIYPGGYRDAQQQHKQSIAVTNATMEKAVVKKAEPKVRHFVPGIGSKKLSYKENQELAALPQQIEVLEKRISLLQTTMSGPDFFNRPYTETQPILAELTQLEKERDAAYLRWQDLEDRA